MSSAACRLPLSGTFSPCLWQVRQRFSLAPPEVGFSSWNLLSDGVRIVTLEAIAHRRRMDRAFQVGGVLVGVAGKAKRVGRCGDQLHASDIFVSPALRGNWCSPWRWPSGRSCPWLCLRDTQCTWRSRCSCPEARDGWPRRRGRRSKSGPIPETTVLPSQTTSPPETNYLCTSITVGVARPPRVSHDHAKLLFRRVIRRSRNFCVEHPGKAGLYLPKWVFLRIQR